MTLRPWRETAVPRPDVLKGTFQQAEFAADISAVRQGRAPAIYQEAGPFFERTYITEGMRLLLTQVAQRLNGRGGEPVIQLQTAFGGGKTHTMLAVYHLATRPGSLNDLAGLPMLLDHAGLMDVPRAKVAILDGTAHPPGQAWKHGHVVIHTLWGELAWQLGGEEGYDLVRDTDTTGTSPGKDLLRELLQRCAPCVVLVDELVAYIRQFSGGTKLSGGTYESNLSFMQSLTEAVKLVDNAILLASLPESVLEAGGQRGVDALQALEKTFGRVQALWKPVAIEESFEIVRRRLFDPVHDEAARDEVCRAFAGLYQGEGAKVPSETHEVRYYERLIRAYPVHPEVFDRLYQDWSTLQSFQRTRGVLKLMAHVIHELWSKGNQDLMILPASLPLYRGKTRDELLTHLAPGWDPVLDRDVDDERAESADLDNREARFGALQAARRVARATFFGSAPSSGESKNVTRGIDRGRILLGCLQPGQTSAVYVDALGRLADRLHYLNASGDKTLDNTRFWFDTRANLRREMEDRKGRFDERNEVRGKVAQILQTLTGGRKVFDAVHIFTPPGDIKDDGELRLVVLHTEQGYAKDGEPPAIEAALDYTRNNGPKPRHCANRLVFLAPDVGALGRLRDSVRTALAWASILADIKGKRLNIDALQAEQADNEAKTAENVAIRAARDCYKWLLAPTLDAPTDRAPTMDAYPINPASEALMPEIERVCQENEIVIVTWSPVHLRAHLRSIFWKADKTAVKAAAVWAAMERYLYFPRLKGRAVFEKAVITGAASQDFFGIAYGQDGDRFEGFRLGAPDVQVDDTLLLIEPDAARAWQAARDAEAAEAARLRSQAAPTPDAAPDPSDASASRPGARTEPTRAPLTGSSSTPRAAAPPAPEPKATAFFGSVDVNAATARMKLITLADEVIALLANDPKATVKVAVEITASFPHGVADHTKRSVTENAAQLGFKTRDWE
jgi:hypothetical protein